MAISQYDISASYTPVNTYVPIPFQEMVAAGASKQKAYDANAAMESDIITSLDDIKALNYVQDPGTKEYYKVGDYDAVQNRKNYYNSIVDQMAMDVVDKGSPAYKTKLKNIILQMRKDMSTEGIFGKAMANYQTYNQTIKDISSSEDAAANPFLLRGRRMDILRYAKSATDGLGTFSSMSPIGKDPQITKKLTDALGNMKPIMTQLYAKEIAPGVIESGKWEEVGINRIKNAAKALIINDPTLKNALVDQAAWDAEVNGQSVDPEQVLDNIANNMANIFVQSRGDRDLKFDAGWAKMREDDIDFGLSGSINYGIKGTDIRDASQLNSKLNVATKSIQDLDNRLSDYEQTLSQNPNATIEDPSTGEQVRVDALRDELQNQKSVYQQEASQLSELDSQAKRFAGISDKDVVAAKQWVINKNAEWGEPIEGAALQPAYPLPKPNYKWEDAPIMTSKKRAYNKFLEEQAKTRVTNATVFPGSKAERTEINDIKSTLLRGETLKWRDSQHTSEDVNSEDRQNINIDNSTYTSWGISQDPETLGRVELYFDTYGAKEQGKDAPYLGTIAVPAPKGFQMRKQQEGMLGTSTQFTLNLIDKQLSNLTGQGKLQLPDFIPNKENIDITVDAPKQEGGVYRVGLPSEKGGVVFQPFTSKQEATDYINNILKMYTEQ